MSRRGTLLIVVAGLAALLSGLALAFIARMRADAEETSAALRETQARLMLLAACDYVLEAGRLGYDAPAGGAAAVHAEAFGWVDVRDGAVGPRTNDGTCCGSAVPAEDGDGDGVADRPAWPAVGGVARAPMFVMRRPPFAIQPIVSRNPMKTDDADPDFGRPFLVNPDPLPARDGFAEFAAGDPRPRPGSEGVAWFRAYRVAPARFVLTCGAGASRGFRDWREVVGARATDAFGDDRALFDAAVAAESRLWYLVEWSAAVKNPNWHSIDHEYGLPDHYLEFPINASLGSNQGKGNIKNLLGSIRWVQRLPRAPARW
jgi:hypothetical protein